MSQRFGGTCRHNFRDIELISGFVHNFHTANSQQILKFRFETFAKNSSIYPSCKFNGFVKPDKEVLNP